MPIRLLDKQTAELIAAGEVVERPASVVKELVENAIDAGARNISVEIQGGGIRLIAVQDDGGGIPAEEIPLAFARHATSKLRSAEDLDGIVTLGFRGEALASIASVAQVELLTRTEADEFACLYRIEGGEEQGLDAAARPVGTTITVRNLFYNTPARMKFLKKDTSEGTYVTEAVTRQALSHPEIAFRYLRDGKQVFVTPGDGELASAAWAVLGSDFARDLLHVDATKGQYHVRGLITPPRAGRASRSMQFFFINDRFVKNRTMMAALEQAYRGMMMQGRYPGGLLFVEMPPALVDVNVHPAKTEVRFAKESDVFDAVYAAVKSALLGASSQHSQLQTKDPAGLPIAQPGTAAPQRPYNAGDEAPLAAPRPFTQEAGTAPAARSAQAQAGGANVHPVGRGPAPEQVDAYNRMVGTLASARYAPYEAGTPTAEKPDAVPANGNRQAAAPVSGSAPVQQSAAQVDEPLQTALVGSQARPDLRVLGEVFDTYIVAEIQLPQQSLCLIDKHAAHERVLYEKLMAQRSAPAAQMLLAPLTVTLSAEEKNALLQNAEALLDAGIEVEDFGGNGVLVRSVPADVEPDDIENLVMEVAARLVVNRNDTLNQKTEWVLHSVSCRAAIKGGDKTPLATLVGLAEDILAGRVPPFCPHGRPIVLEIGRKELEKQFGRLG